MKRYFEFMKPRAPAAALRSDRGRRLELPGEKSMSARTLGRRACASGRAHKCRVPASDTGHQFDQGAGGEIGADQKVGLQHDAWCASGGCAAGVAVVRGDPRPGLDADTPFGPVEAPPLPLDQWL